MSTYMAIPLFRLLDDSKGIVAPGKLVWEGPHEKAAGAYQQRFQVAEGHIILTTWQEKLHCIIYQTPAEDEERATHRNNALFLHYGDGHEFNEILDNGFGKTYRRADMARFALWSYAMDYTTIGTMDFHAVMWG